MPKIATDRSHLASSTRPTQKAPRRSAEEHTYIVRHIEAHGLTLEWILDTHPHADHFSAAGYLKDMTRAATGIGDPVTEVQRLWKQIYNLPDTVATDGSQWDHLFAEKSFGVGTGS